MCPTTKIAQSLTSFRAAATACSGSQKSSAVISFYLLAEHAAGGVEVRHGQLRTALKLLAEPGFLSRDRPRQSDQHIRQRRLPDPGGKHYDRQDDQSAHDYASRMLARLSLNGN